MMRLLLLLLMLLLLLLLLQLLLLPLLLLLLLRLLRGIRGEEAYTRTRAGAIHCLYTEDLYLYFLNRSIGPSCRFGTNVVDIFMAITVRRVLC